MTKKQTRQKSKRKGTQKRRKGQKGSPGRWSMEEASRFALYTLIYALFIMFIAGFVKDQWNDLYYLTIGKWNIPLDIQEGFYTLAMAIWAASVLIMNVKYKLE